jgi:hypothetical protein
MKFYREKQDCYYWTKIRVNKLTAILNSKNTETYANCVYFFKNGRYHNAKNADYTDDNGFKDFCLNGKHYGNENLFTKETWRRFVKLQAFL